MEEGENKRTEKVIIYNCVDLLCVAVVAAICCNFTNGDFSSNLRGGSLNFFTHSQRLIYDDELQILSCAAGHCKESWVDGKLFTEKTTQRHQVKNQHYPVDRW